MGHTKKLKPNFKKRINKADDIFELILIIFETSVFFKAAGKVGTLA